MKGIIGSKDIHKIIFLYSVRYIVPYIPLKLLYKFAELISAASARGKKGEEIRRAVEELFGVGVLSNEQMVQAVQGAITNYRKDLFETWAYKRLDIKTIKMSASFEGIEHLEKAMKEGKGAILAVCHFGAYKTLLPQLGYRGYKITQVAANPLEFTGKDSSFIKNKVMEMELEYEKNLPAKFLYLGNSVRELFRILDNNEIVVISVDGVVGTQRVTFPLLNRKVRLSPAIEKLAKRSGAAILPVFTIRERNDRQRVVIHDELIPNGDEGSVLAEYAGLMESYIRNYPSHYAWYLYKNNEDPPSIGKIITDHNC
jgi:KDO2-lipid IV(A) lauroyltransferase